MWGSTKYELQTLSDRGKKKKKKKFCYMVFLLDQRRFGELIKKAYKKFWRGVEKQKKEVLLWCFCSIKGSLEN